MHHAMHLQFEEHKVPEVVSMHPNNWHCKIPSRKDQTVSEQCIYKSRVGLSEAKTIKLMHLYVCVCGVLRQWLLRNHIICQLCLTVASICMLILAPTSKNQCGTLWLHT